MTKELITPETMVPKVSHNPGSLISMAVEKGASIEHLKMLMELQERYEDREAKKLYVKAMAEFKKDPPIIVKDTEVHFKNTHYNHASLGQVSTKINTALSKHGLTAAWKTGQDEREITVTCVITHEAGHSESTSLSSPPDNSGGKNAIQGIGSSVSYLSRYTILALTGLSTGEGDDDGASSGYSAGKVQAMAVNVKRFKEGINHYKKEKFSADDLSKWFEGKNDSFLLLNKKDAQEVEAYCNDMIDWLDQNGKFAEKKETGSGKMKMEV